MDAMPLAPGLRDASTARIVRRITQADIPIYVRSKSGLTDSSPTVPVINNHNSATASISLRSLSVGDNRPFSNAESW